MFTTVNWHKHMTDVIRSYPLGTFTAISNRIGNKVQKR